MKLLITGANGQVGWELVQKAKLKGFDTSSYDKNGLDICDKNKVFKIIGSYQPDIVINAAAYTDVDGAEDNISKAMSVNRDGCENIAQGCAIHNLPMLHISTDYIFDGGKKSAYLEDDDANPLGIYGKSKWEGELAIRSQLRQHIILRTSWIFGVHGNNFVKKIIKKGSKLAKLQVVEDQFGAPTPASAVACALLTISEQVINNTQERWGTYHYSGSPVVSWFDFANEVFCIAESVKGLKPPVLEGIKTSEFPCKAMRPLYSELACDRIKKYFSIVKPSWKPALNEVIKNI